MDELGRELEVGGNGEYNGREDRRSVFLITVAEDSVEDRELSEILEERHPRLVASWKPSPDEAEYDVPALPSLLPIRGRLGSSMISSDTGRGE